MKIKIVNQEKTLNEDKKKLYQENAGLYSNFAEIYSKKTKQIKQIDSEKNKILSEAQNKIYDLEEQKLKHEFKANILEDENKLMFNDYIEAMKKSNLK